jgi:hypothetical protein
MLNTQNPNPNTQKIENPPPEYCRKYSRVYSESSFNKDSEYLFKNFMSFNSITNIGLVERSFRMYPYI